MFNTAKALLICEILSLVLAIATLLTCVGVLLFFVRDTLRQPNPMTKATSAEDAYKAHSINMVELQGQQYRSGQRTSLLRTVGTLAGIASIFLGVSMFLLAIRTETPNEVTISRGITRILPAIVALLCGAIILGMCVRDPSQADNNSNYAPVQMAPVFNQAAAAFDQSLNAGDSYLTYSGLAFAETLAAPAAGVAKYLTSTW